MRIAWLLFAALNADSDLDYAARIRGLEARAAADGAARLLADPLRVVTNALTSSFELMPLESSDERHGALAAFLVGAPSLPWIVCVAGIRTGVLTPHDPYFPLNHDGTPKIDLATLPREGLMAVRCSGLPD